MLKGCKILTSFCVICATLYGGAYGAASVRGGATSRAGSIRTLGAGTTASVKTTTARTQPTATTAVDTGSTETAGGSRMPVASGLSGSKLPGRISGNTSSSGDSQNVAELRQAIEQLRNDYDALGEQYNNLSSDISNVSDTAQVARDVAANNTNTLTVVRTDLSVAQSDIEDLKASGGFDEDRVQATVESALAGKSFATRAELASTDAVARGAVQVADLPQKLNALNVADKSYVDMAVATGIDEERVQGIVSDSLNNTLGNYYTKKQINDVIDIAKNGMVDKDYVDYQVQTSVGDKATYSYVDSKVATGMNEETVRGVINDSLGGVLVNYYTKNQVDDAIGAAVDVAKAGMVDRDYVDNQVRDMASKDYVDNKVANIETGVDTGVVYDIIANQNYKTGAEVQGIVDDTINGTLGNYYTKEQVNDAIDLAKSGMVDKDYIDYNISTMAPKNWVTGQIDSRINNLNIGLDRDAVKGVVEEYGYKTEDDVRNIVTGYNYATMAELPDMVKQWAPGAELQYADGKLYFVDKDGNDRVVDIRGLDGQDGSQVELRKSDGQIQWRWTSGDDQLWHELIKTSELAGVDGKSIEMDVVGNNLVWKKEGESGWQYLYNLGDINGIDGCGVRANTANTANGTKVRLLKDCTGQPGDGQLLTEFEVINGADGTVSEAQIIEALESNSTFVQLRNKVNTLSAGVDDTNSLVNELSNRVDNNTTGLAATNTLANNAWNKVKDLEATNATAREYVDNRIGNLGFDLSTYRNFESVAAKLGAIDGTKTVKEYVDTAVAGVNTNIKVKQGRDGYTYICKTGNNCTGEPDVYSDDWARISVDVSGYLTQSDANGLYAPIGLVTAVDTAQSAATQAQTQAGQAWGKLSDLGNLTVKDYVDNYFDNTIGFLGTNLLSGKNYSVADKIGIPGSDTVKKYIDDKVAGVNTKIKVERSGIDGKTYICKNGDACTSQAGPYSTDEWVPVSVDMSGYLTENDADKLYAPIATKTTAESAASVAAAAQTAASEAKTKADDSWNKLSDLGYQTVRQYVEEKLEDISTSGGSGVSIRVETGSDGYTYICTATSSDCRDSPSSTSSYWRRIEFNIPSEYLTESEGNDLYALKNQIGTLGGSFTNVGDKIGLNDYQYGNTSVKDYIDNKVGNISTNILVQTSTVDGFTYICRTGNTCTGEPSQNSSQWAKVNVDLGNLGINPSSGQAYNVATKIGLIDSTNINKTVVQYITEKIGNLGNYTDSYGSTQPYSVLAYLQANYTPKVTIGSLGKPSSGDSDYTVAEKIGLTGANSSKTVYSYIGDRIGDIGFDSSSYQPKSVKQYLTETYVPLTTIGNLGYPMYSSTPYTVEGKIGLNSTTDSSKTVKQYVDGLIGTSSLGTYDNVIAYGNANYAPKSAFDTLSSTVSGHTDLLAGLGSGVTVKDYVDSKAPNIQIEPGSGGTMYYCKWSTACDTAHAGDSQYGWASFNISNSLSLSSYLEKEEAANTYLTITNAANTYAPKSVQSAVENPTTGLSATYNLASSASTAASNAQQMANAAQSAATTAQSTADVANTTANNAWDKVKGLNDVSGLTDKTVTGYVAYRLGNITSGQTVQQYIDSHTPTITVTEGTDGNSYICTGGSCTGTPPAGSGWTKLNVDLTGINTILSGFGGTGQPGKVKEYVDDKFALKATIGNLGMYYQGYDQLPFTVEKKIGLNTSDTSSMTVKGYVDAVNDRIGNLGKKADSTDAASVAEKLGTEITDASKTVAGYIAARIGNMGNNGNGSAYNNVVDYVSDKFALNTKIGNMGTPNDSSTPYTVEGKIGLTGDNSSKTVKGYVDAVNNRIGDLGGKDGTAYTVLTKLGNVGNNQTVTDYIESYVDSHTTSINVKPGADGNTYICTGSNCTTYADHPELDPTNWTPLNVNLKYIDDILAGFGTGTGKVETVMGYVNDKTGSLGNIATDSPATSVAAKLGTEITNANKTVAKYISDKIGEIDSTQTVKSYVDGAIGELSGTYAAKSTETVADDAWNRVKNLGKDVNGYDYTTVAGRLGFGTDTNSKTVKDYVDDSIGSLGGSYTSVAAKLGSQITDTNMTVAQYIADSISNGGVQVTTYGGEPYICSNNCSMTPPCTYPDICGWQKLTIDISSKADQSDMTAVQTILTGFGSGAGNWGTVKGYIGEMGGYTYMGNYTPYTVETKIGLTDNNASKSVVQYIADRLGFTDSDVDKTVAEYVAAHATSGGNVQVKTVGTDTYICSDKCDVYNTPPCANGTYPGTCGWQKLEISFDGYATESYVKNKIGFAENSTKTVKEYVDDWMNLGNDPFENSYTSVGAKIGDVGAVTVKDYIDANKPTVKVTSGGDGNTYICSENCGTQPPCSDTATCGWTLLEVNLDDINAILDGFGGDGEPDTVKGYVDGEIGDLGYINNDTLATSVAAKLGFGTDDNITVKQYIDEHAGTGGVDQSVLEDYALKTYVDGKIGTLGGDYANVGAKININSGTVKSYVDAVDNKFGDLGDFTNVGARIGLDSESYRGVSVKDYVKTSIEAVVGNLGSRIVNGEQEPYNVATKIGDIDSTQTIKDYIDNNMPNIDVRPGTGDANKNKLYICTKPNCDTDNIPGGDDSGWVELDIASAIDLSFYLQTADLPNQLGQEAAVTAIKSAVSTELDSKLNKSGIKLERDGDKIMISGGGIGTSYEVAKVSDFMCASYRMRQINPGEEGYVDGSVTYEMICVTEADHN